MNVFKQISLVMAGCFAAVQFTCAQTWTQTSAPLVGWNSIASSADGSVVYVAGGGLYGVGVSTNWGATWGPTPTLAPAQNWFGVASSADGLKVAATTIINLRQSFSPLYTSTDGGITWISNTVPIHTTMSWVTCSEDGSKLIAQDGGLTNGMAILCASTNFGITWVTNYRPNLRWSHPACSADGSKVVMAGKNSLFFSTNAGFSWTLITNVSGSPIVAIAASASGTRLVGTDGNVILVSTNSGFAWKQTSAPTNVPWSSVATSADGSRLVAAAGSAFSTGPIYTSSDSGATWVSNNAPASWAWSDIASSADGLKLYVIGGTSSGNGGVTGTGGVWTAQSTPIPRLNLLLTNGTAKFSWTIPSTNFVLQQVPDLITGIWANVTNIPGLNFSNLQNEVTLPVTNDAGFFRLKTP